MTTEKRIDCICSKCGSDNVGWKQVTYWNKKTQDTYTEDMDEGAYCFDCEDKCIIEEKYIMVW
jgi:hypothetical protein